MTQRTFALAIGYGSLFWCNVGITSAEAKAFHLHNNNNNKKNNNFIYVSSVFSWAQRIYQLGRQEIKSTQIKSNQMLVFGERRKPKYSGKNLSEQRREPKKTQPTYDVRSGNRTSYVGHIGGRLVLSPLCQHWNLVTEYDSSGQIRTG